MVVRTRSMASEGTATSEDGQFRVEFPPGALSKPADIRLTAVSPQGLAGRLPFGWSPAPGAVVDIRPWDASNMGASLLVPARLRLEKAPGLSSESKLVFVRYDEDRHCWEVVAAQVTAGPEGAVEAEVRTLGQYALLAPDTGPTAPPEAQLGLPLRPGRSVPQSALNTASVSAVAVPSAAFYGPGGFISSASDG